MKKHTSPEFDISEIVGAAITNADEWLEKALKQADRHMDGSVELRPAPIAGFMIAAAISYHADRQVDAAEIIAKAILEAASKGEKNG